MQDAVQGRLPNFMLAELQTYIEYISLHLLTYNKVQSVEGEFGTKKSSLDTTQQ